ncbi:diguanylate cyclase [Alteromonas sp. ASW11-19]|uniref:diguanylate cyclase n=1 Tax=Alteromonas salexigens TaxID=2982530 RepID=A0ABT2VPU5_9ALTE|nr:diguanylate cyclase [Alteromonas salexigens]MCU7555335.1 diguanylate cyclase [Alteromonas salexigens]
MTRPFLSGLFYTLVLLIGVCYQPQALAAEETPSDTWPAVAAPFAAEIRKTPDTAIRGLQSAYASAISNEEKAGVHALLSRAYSALLLHQKALEHAEHGLGLVTPDQQPWLFHQLAVAKAEALETQGLAREGLALTRPAIDWAKTNQRFDLLTYALSIQGYIHLALSTTDDALALFQEGYRLAQDRTTQLRPEDFASMIALVFEYRGEWEQAISFYQQAETYYRNTNASLELANTLFGLGRAYYSTGNPQKGLSLLKDSANLALEIGDLQGAAYSYAIMAGHLIQQGKLIDAETFLNEALGIFEDADNPYMQIQTLISLAKIEENKQQFDEAMRLLNRADDIAEGDVFLAQSIRIGLEKSRLYASFGEYEKAYQLMLIIRDLQTRLEQQQNSQRLLELRTAFDLEQQEAKNALLTEQNLRQQTQLLNERKLQQYIFAMVFLLIVICLLLLYLYVNGKRHQERLELLANEDELTGMLTRRKTMEVLDNQVQLAIRHNEPLVVALLDLDHFKKINDTFGHQTGDEVLRTFGSLAKSSFRTTDILGRIGGEEFLFAFPHTQPGQAEEMLRRFINDVKTIPGRIRNPRCKVSASVGLVSSAMAETPRELTVLADEALYKAKQAGRDRIVQARQPG